VKRIIPYLIFLAVYAAAVCACLGDFDPTKAPPRMATMGVFKPAAPGTYLIQNQDRGGFHATFANSLKGFFVPIQPSFKGTVRIENCGASDITRDAGVHTDGLWLAADKSHATTLMVEVIDCSFINIDGVGLLWENGSAKRLHLKRVLAAGKGGDFTIKLMPGCVIDELVLEGCQGRVSFGELGGKVNTAYIVGHRGAQPAFPKSVARVVAGLPADVAAPATPTVEELQAKVKTLEKRISDLEAEARTLRERLAQIVKLAA
jgi:hypothetical protein